MVVVTSSQEEDDEDKGFRTIKAWYQLLSGHGRVGTWPGWPNEVNEPTSVIPLYVDLSIGNTSNF